MLIPPKELGEDPSKSLIYQGNLHRDPFSVFRFLRVLIMNFAA